jgi:hypothetical protein
MVSKIKKHRNIFRHPEDDTDEDWMRSHWRPAMAWAYMAICLFDFIIAPTGVAFLITFFKANMPIWQSLTLSNGGVMHLAFGAILGVSAWGRTKESVTSTQFAPGSGFETTVVNRQTDTVVSQQQSSNQNVKPAEVPDTNPFPNIVDVPKPRPPVIT